MAGGKLRRRKLLIGAGATATAVAALSGVSAEASNGRLNRVAGVLEAISASAATIRTFEDGARQVVTFLPNATFSHDGPAASTAFRPGEEVVVELVGARSRRASHMTLLYTLTEGTITSLTAESVTTTGGSVRVDSGTALHPVNDAGIRLPLSALAVGQGIRVMQRADPPATDRLARAIFIQS